MAGVARFKCTRCPFGLTHYAYIERVGHDGRKTLFDRRFCYRCGRITQCQYLPPEEVDPAIGEMHIGNRGRILDHLYEHGPLLFANWPSGTGLPTPRKIRKVCGPLLSYGLVTITDDGVFLGDGVSDRIKQYRHRPPCGDCGTPYIWPETCPKCGAELRNVGMGRATDEMIELA